MIPIGEGMFLSDTLRKIQHKDDDPLPDGSAVETPKDSFEMERMKSDEWTEMSEAFESLATAFDPPEQASSLCTSVDPVNMQMKMGDPCFEETSASKNLRQSMKAKVPGGKKILSSWGPSTCHICIVFRCPVSCDC